MISCGGTWRCAMTIMGKALDEIPLIVRAWQHAGQLGFGNREHRVQSQLNQVRCGEEIVFDRQHRIIVQYNRSDLNRFSIPMQWSALQQIRLRFVTPIRLQHRNYIVSRSEQLDGKQLLIALFNRLRHCQQQHDKNMSWIVPYTAYSDFISDIEQLTVVTALEAIRVKRHSSRQHKHIDLFGLIGDVQITASSHILEKLMPLLWLGQYLHLGKNTTLGFGQYQLYARTNNL